MTAPHLTFESADGVEIAIADYRGCSPDEFLARVRMVRDWIILQPPGSAIVLTLAAGVCYRPDAMHELVSILRETRPHIRASAVVGLGHLTLLIRVINHLSARRVEAFEDIDEARRWLRTRPEARSIHDGVCRLTRSRAFGASRARFRRGRARAR